MSVNRTTVHLSPSPTRAPLQVFVHCRHFRLKIIELPVHRLEFRLHILQKVHRHTVLLSDLAARLRALLERSLLEAAKRASVAVAVTVVAVAVA